MKAIWSLQVLQNRAAWQVTKLNTSKKTVQLAHSLSIHRSVNSGVPVYFRHDLRSDTRLGRIGKIGLAGHWSLVEIPVEIRNSKTVSDFKKKQIIPIFLMN